jgi:predicted nuclease with TOPRIM domain
MENGELDAQSLSDCEENDTDMLDTSKKKGKGSSKTMVPKGTDEYVRKRARNNEAVRKSRVKSKKKIEETQLRVNMLSQENSELKTKVTLLTKELNVLRSLFANGGITIPEHVTVEKTLEVDTEPSCSVTVKSETNDGEA